MKRRVSHYSLHWQSFSPEWLAGFTPRPMDGYPDLTVKDLALALAVIGRFSSTFHDTRDPGTKHGYVSNLDFATNMLVDCGRFKLADFADEPEIDVLKLRDEVAVKTSRDVERMVSRIATMMIGDRTIPFSGLDVWEGKLTTHLDEEVMRAHPINSWVRQSVSIDVYRFARFKTVQSVPIATRAIAWVYSKSKKGLERQHPFFEVADDGKRRMSVSLRIKADDVTKVFGLAQMRVWKPHLLRIDKIKVDLLTVGIVAQIEWTYDGRTPAVLEVTFRRDRFDQVRMHKLVKVKGAVTLPPSDVREMAEKVRARAQRNAGVPPPRRLRARPNLKEIMS